MHYLCLEKNVHEVQKNKMKKTERIPPSHTGLISPSLGQVGHQQTTASQNILVSGWLIG